MQLEHSSHHQLPVVECHGSAISRGLYYKDIKGGSVFSSNSLSNNTDRHQETTGEELGRISVRILR